MKRFHVHVHVNDLDASVQFYSTLFGEEPVVIKRDYAKWMLEDPRVNFAISSGANTPAIDHLGFQVESDEDLTAIAQRLNAAGESALEQENATCCYARGNKRWVSDPNRIPWETFHTLGESTVYGNDIASRREATARQTSEACCVPAASAGSGCCAASESE